MAIPLLQASMAAHRAAPASHAPHPTIFGSLTTVPLRAASVRQILRSFETHEGGTLPGQNKHGPRISDFWVVVDRALNLSPELLRIQSERPWATFTSKSNESEFGQAKSINLVFKGLRASKASYWLKWEDSWVVSRPFIFESFLLLSRADITEVHVCTASLRAIPPTRQIEEHAGVRFQRRHPKDRAPRIQRRCDNYEPGRGHGYLVDPGDPSVERQVDVWPNFSLRPGIIKAAPVLEVGPFDTQASLWPYKFETLWACRFFEMHPETVDQFAHLQGGATKPRDESYLSTYRMPQMGTPDWLAKADKSAAYGVQPPHQCKCEQSRPATVQQGVLRSDERGTLEPTQQPAPPSRAVDHNTKLGGGSKKHAHGRKARRSGVRGHNQSSDYRKY